MDEEDKPPPISMPPQPILTSVQCVARSQLCIEGVPHVVSLVSEFLDCRLLWDLPRACKTGDVALLRFVARREELHASPWVKNEPLYRPWRFSNASAVAVQHGAIDALRWLLTEYDTESMLGNAVEEAASSGHLHVIKWLHDNFFERTFWSGDGIVNAVANNHLETAQWLRENTTSRDSWKHVRGVAKTGNIGMLRWLKTIGARPTTRTVAVAARYGHLEAAQFIVKQWNMPLRRMHIDGAAAHGHLDVVNWLLDSGSSFSADAASGAAANGHLHVLEWLYTNKAWPTYTTRLSNAMRTGTATNAARVCCLDYPWERIFSTNGMDGAAANGHLHVVQWMHDNQIGGCTTAAMDRAASNGHLEIVQWLHHHRSEGCTAAAMDGAAKNNHLEIVQWLHRHRMEGATVAAMDEAARSGHLEMVQWLHQNREEGCTTRAMDGASARGHLGVVKWLHDNRNEGCTVAAMNGAAEGGHFSVLKWLHQHRNEGCSTAKIEGVAKIGRLDIIQWLIEECGCECNEQAMVVAVKNGHFDVVLYLDHRKVAWMPEDVAIDAVRCGHLEIARWLLRCHRTQLSWWALARVAKEHHQYFCAQWFRSDVPRHSWVDLSELRMPAFT